MALAEVRCSCGRFVLFVAGIALAMEGDACRDGSLPNTLYNPIPEGEMAYATIGGRPVAGMPEQVIRFFRGDQWNEAMLRYVAEKINAA